MSFVQQVKVIKARVSTTGITERTDCWRTCLSTFPLFVYFASLEWVIAIAEIFDKVLLQTETKPFIVLKSFHCSFILPRWNEWSQSLKYSTKSFCRQKQNLSLCWKVSTVRLLCLTGMSDHNRWNIQQSHFADRNKTFHYTDKDVCWCAVSKTATHTNHLKIWTLRSVIHVKYNQKCPIFQWGNQFAN